LTKTNDSHFFPLLPVRGASYDGLSSCFSIRKIDHSWFWFFCEWWSGLFSVNENRFLESGCEDKKKGKEKRGEETKRVMFISGL
jgi:hypothetical protein